MKAKECLWAPIMRASAFPEALALAVLIWKIFRILFVWVAIVQLSFLPCGMRRRLLLKVMRCLVTSLRVLRVRSLVTSFGIVLCEDYECEKTLDLEKVLCEG